MGLLLHVLISLMCIYQISQLQYSIRALLKKENQTIQMTSPNDRSRRKLKLDRTRISCNNNLQLYPSSVLFIPFIPHSSRLHMRSYRRIVVSSSLRAGQLRAARNGSLPTLRPGRSQISRYLNRFPSRNPPPRDHVVY